MVCFRYLIGVSLAMLSFIGQSSITGATSAAIDIGNCVNFAILGSTGVTFSGAISTVSEGSVGVTPGTSVSGTYVLQNGTMQINTAETVSCATYMMAAYVSIALQTNCTNATAPVDLAGAVLDPGVYCNGDGYFLITANTLTLKGNSSDIWVFKAATSVTTGSATSIILLGGALASNVFWQVGTTLQTGDSSLFIGTILAGTSIILGPSSTLYGHALAQAAVSCAGNNQISSFLAGITSEPSAIPTISPSFRPSKIPSQAPISPSAMPTFVPTEQPSRTPTQSSSWRPTSQPSSAIPTFVPTQQPSQSPSWQPSLRPTSQPSSQPSMAPTGTAVTMSQSAVRFTPVALICVCVFGSVGFIITLAAVYSGIKKGRDRVLETVISSAPTSMRVTSATVEAGLVEIEVM